MSSIRASVVSTIVAQLNDMYVSGAGSKQITVVDTLFNPKDTPPSDLPKFSCIPAPQSIKVGLFGTTTDSDYKVLLIGYTFKNVDETLVDTSEDIIQAIINKLTNASVVVPAFFTAGFSLVEINPVLNEQWDEVGMMAYMSMLLHIQFVED